MMLFIKHSKISLLVLFLAAALGGCAVDEQPASSQAGSSLPWNRPASWEGAGALGAAMQGTP